MRKLQQFCGAMMLVIAMAISVAAGDIHTGVASPPPPPPVSALADEPEALSDGAIRDSVDSETLVTEIAFTLLQLLSVF